MNLILISYNISESAKKRFADILASRDSNKALFLTTAAVPYGLDPWPEWLSLSLAEVNQFADEVDIVSLEENTWIPEKLDDYGFVFVSGGNSFYLAYRLAETGFGDRLKGFIEKGGIYAG